MPIKGVQVRMARAALDWTVQDLAARAQISKNTVTSVEAERTDTHATSLAAIEHVMTAAGIEFPSDKTGLVSDYPSVDAPSRSGKRQVRHEPASVLRVTGRGAGRGCPPPGLWSS
jgi:DNA-binding XRE family transcriptional regulator